MGKYLTSNSVLCPFYLAEESHCIHCEGVEKGSTVRMSFEHTGKKKAYRERFCEEDYDRCRISQMLTRKWEEEEE